MYLEGVKKDVLLLDFGSPTVTVLNFWTIKVPNYFSFPHAREQKEMNEASEKGGAKVSASE